MLNEESLVEDNKKELLTVAQEKTQLLMLYYGSENIREPMDFNDDKAREILLETYRVPIPFKGDKNDGENKWMSSLLNDTHDLIIDAYADEDDLNTILKDAGENHSRLQEDFIDEAIRLKLLYNNITAETWR